MKEFQLVKITRLISQFKRYKRKYNRMMENQNPSSEKLAFLKKRIEKLRVYVRSILAKVKLAGAIATLGLLLNAGNASAQIFGPVTNNPFGLTNPTGASYFNSFAQGDLDNDGDMDILTNSWVGSNGTFFYYQNSGSVGAPSFGAQVINPFGLPILGSNFYNPTLVDLDNDGDLDIMAGAYGLSSLFYFQNTGTVSSPSFAAPITNPFGINTFTLDFWGMYNVDLADLDNDGDLDMLVGDYGANLHYFQNTGSVSAPAFAAPVMNPFGLTAGFRWAAPEFNDYDGDGDLDIMSGDRNDGFYYYENTGTVSSPNFPVKVNNPDGLGWLGSIGGFPELYDYDNDGDDDLLVGSSLLNFYYLERCLLPSAPVSTTPSASLSICSGASVILTASGTSISWYDASTGGTLLGTGSPFSTDPIVSTTTIYAESNNTCGASSRTPITVTVAPLPVAPINTTPSVNLSVCSGQSTTLTASGSVGGFLQWFDASTAGTYLGLGTSFTTGALTSDTTFYVQFYDTCSLSSSFTAINVTVNPLPNIATTTSGVTVTATLSGATYQWIDCNNADLPISGATAQSFTATSNGDYAVIVNNGTCSDTSACVSITTVDVSNIFLTSNISIVPNPTSSQITITAPAEFTSVKITDVNGRLILVHENEGLKAMVNLSSFENGMYFIQLFKGDNALSQTKKLVLNK